MIVPGSFNLKLVGNSFHRQRVFVGIVILFPLAKNSNPSVVAKDPSVGVVAATKLIIIRIFLVIISPA